MSTPKEILLLSKKFSPPRGRIKPTTLWQHVSMPVGGVIVVVVVVAACQHACGRSYCCCCCCGSMSACLWEVILLLLLWQHVSMPVGGVIVVVVVVIVVDCWSLISLVTIIGKFSVTTGALLFVWSSWDRHPEPTAQTVIVNLQHRPSL